jgi:uncharacterized protein YcgI (DUF1989 family)
MMIIPAGKGKAIELHAGQHARVGLPVGSQVADMFAFALPSLDEVLSTAHTRSCALGLCPKPGNAFYSNQRRAMITLVEDTSPGVHDLLLSACDQARYTLLGHPGPHANCNDNVLCALQEGGWLMPPGASIPNPVNLFEHVAISPDGCIEIRAPLAKKGDAVTLRADMDLVLVISACPMDIMPTNGNDLKPKPVSLELI